MPQPKKTYKQLEMRKYVGTSDLLAKTRFKDENDNISASFKRNITHKTSERKFEFAFKKLHEVLNKSEEKSVECELISSVRNWVSDNNSLGNVAKWHPTFSRGQDICY